MPQGVAMGDKAGPMGQDGAVDVEARQGPAMRGSAVKQRIGLTLAIFIGVTAVVSAIGFWLHVHYAIAYWVFNLGSFGPLAGGLAVLALNRPLGLGARWVPGLGFNSQVVRRTLLITGVALAIVLACVQFYTFFRWQMKPIDLPLVPHPLALPGDVGTIFGLVALGMLIGLIMEEFAWRTVLQPTLRQRYNVLTTGVVLGAIWATWSWPAWQGAITRLMAEKSVLEFILFLAGHYVTCVAISLILVVLHARMRVGHWVSAVVFRLIFGLGFFLILDEEAGRWQAMFAISLACSAAAAVGLYYYRRAALAQRARTARDQSARSTEPGPAEAQAGSL